MSKLETLDQALFQPLPQSGTATLVGAINMTYRGGTVVNKQIVDGDETNDNFVY
ncbi:MAG TPA: hypothetical protein VFE05_10090 [Longimicrobiaceae bacterium]|jgi:hypothetical protein|nr:hypothetical protein [Longimicrobiaceae bacterium]